MVLGRITQPFGLTTLRFLSAPKSLSEVEIIQLLKMAKTLLNRYTAGTCHAALYAMGLRVSELVSLLVVQFRRNPQTILVKGKGGASEWFHSVKPQGLQRFAGSNVIQSRICAV